MNERVNSAKIGFRMLFVCMGNVCRSPTAQAVFRRLLEAEGIAPRVEVDSAGTHGYHVGEQSDPRTRRAAASRGYDLAGHYARKIAWQDLQDFDLILAMDKANRDNLRQIAAPEQQGRIQLLMDYSANFDDEEVPDPYYGLGHTFDLVIDMVEDASLGLLKVVQKALKERPRSE
jgi:protein-tyrosine phosphatase